MGRRRPDAERGAGPVFLDLPPEHADATQAAAVVVPVPYEATSSWLPGSARGPHALLEASTYVELLDLETGTQPYVLGIATHPPVEFDGPPEALAERVEAAVGPLLDRGQLPIVVGGEHSVTIGAVRAAANRYADLGVLQLDAHGDTREEYRGSRYNHACVMARSRDLCSIVQVGIRSLGPSELVALDRERLFFAADIAGTGDLAWMDRVVDLLPETTYVTIDVDVFDTGVFPATGTPEPGGLGWYEVTRLLSHVAHRRRVIGFDLVELLPTPGLHAGDFTAAKLVYRFLAEIFAGGQR